jgi:rsbT co-antagonist protein RsbR
MPFVYTTNLSEVRALAERQARMAGLPDERVVDFVIAVSEVAGNTVRHAKSPGSMRIWSDDKQLICEIKDAGVIADPLAGSAPPPRDADGGHGLWLVNQVCDRVDLRSDAGGTVIRMYMFLPLGCPAKRCRLQPLRRPASDVALGRMNFNEVLTRGSTAVDDGKGRTRMADYLREHRDKITGRWSEFVLAGVRGRTSPDEVRRDLDDLYSLIVRAASGADDHADGELRAALDDLSRSRARDGYMPSETARGVFSLKEAVYELVADSADLVTEYLAFSRLIDDLGLRTFEAYSAAREEIISDQATAMLELSTPVVRLWDGIIAVPLVGTLDSARTQLVMEKLLDTLVTTGANHAVVDITGVPTVDTEVAQHLLKTVAAVRLLGAECTISGIRPQVAQTIVSLGIEFGDIATKANLADALALALRKAGMKVVPAE